MEKGFARLIAELLGLPEWSPKGIRRVAASILAAAVVFWPATFEAGVEIWADHMSEKLIERMQPLLAELASTG